MSFTDVDHLEAAESALAEGKSVLSIFEKAEPDDKRPREALNALNLWMRGEATVTEVRAAAFAAHDAARETTNLAARYAARACGQAAAVAHVIHHAPHASRYAAKAIEANKSGA
jgi:hypothetical protein